MHNRVDVTFSIKADVEKKKPKKSLYGNTSARPQRAVSPPQLIKREEKATVISSPAEKKNESRNNDFKTSPPHVLSSSGHASPVKRPVTSGGYRKPNAENKAPYNQNSMICPDRDLLRYEQDAEISKYNLTHKILDDSDVLYPNPHISSNNQRQVKKDKSVIRRERFVPNTCGTALNNSLEFHPHLKVMQQQEAELKQHHSEKWMSATLKEDDPERCRPEKDKAKLLNSEFQREYMWTKTVVPDLKVHKENY